MTATKETTIWCDGVSCGNWERDSKTAAMLRRQLKKMGWTRDGGKDYCPNCSTELKARRKADA